jgi:hypothetical protein
VGLDTFPLCGNLGEPESQPCFFRQGGPGGSFCCGCTVMCDAYVFVGVDENVRIRESYIIK